jgi:predicted enzyme related to lactoylglutathione lyase
MQQDSAPQLAGVELYFADLQAGIRFYRDLIGLEVAEQEPGHYAKFDTGGGFLCVERKGSETYPSTDKAVVFLRVADLAATIARIGREHIVQSGPGEGTRPTWAVLHDPEGYNVLLLQA